MRQQGEELINISILIYVYEKIINQETLAVSKYLRDS